MRKCNIQFWSPGYNGVNTLRVRLSTGQLVVVLADQQKDLKGICRFVQTSLRLYVLAILLGLLLPVAIQAQTVHARWMEAGAGSKINGARPRPLDMEAQKPASITKVPDGIETPLYGVLTMGNVDAPTGFGTVMDSAAAGEPRIWIDSNGNGDLTDDPPIVWKKSAYSPLTARPLPYIRVASWCRCATAVRPCPCA